MLRLPAIIAGEETQDETKFTQLNSVHCSALKCSAEVQFILVQFSEVEHSAVQCIDLLCNPV